MQPIQRYQIEAIKKHTITERVPKWGTRTDKHGREVQFVSGFEDITREVVGGFMVYLPSKQAFFVESAAELERLKLSQEAQIVDLDSGEPWHGPVPIKLPDLREAALAHTRGVNAA